MMKSMAASIWKGFNAECNKDDWMETGEFYDGGGRGHVCMVGVTFRPGYHSFQ